MNRIIALVLLTTSAIAFAQAPQIKSGATVYIERLGGYETYLPPPSSKSTSFIHRHRQEQGRLHHSEHCFAECTEHPAGCD